MALVLSSTLSGCATGRRSDVQYDPPEFNVLPDPVYAASHDHRLGSSDLVKISVYRAPELTGEYRVDGSGQIMLPLIGLMQVQGMTTTELAAAITQRLSGTYYVNPDVSVALAEAPNRTITVDGAVGSAGIYPVVGRTTLMQAIAMAKGASGGANLRRIYIFRQINGQRMVAGFDLQAIRNAEMEDPLVHPSDIIIVDGDQTRQTLRDVLMTIPIIGLFRPFVL